MKRFKLSNDPAFYEKLEDIVGLYLDPPKNAIVLSIDEKSQVQALERAQPILPLRYRHVGARLCDGGKVPVEQQPLVLKTCFLGNGHEVDGLQSLAGVGPGLRQRESRLGLGAEADDVAERVSKVWAGKYQSDATPHTSIKAASTIG